MASWKRLRRLVLLLLTLCLCNRLLLFWRVPSSTTLREQENKNAAIFKDFTPFGSTGGVVVFYHIPRTGGTTIRETMQQHVSFYRVTKPGDFPQAEQRITAVFQGSREVLLIELHGNVPGLRVLHHAVQQWRKQSWQTGIPLFTFTIIREPVAFSRSYFDHFHSHNCTWNWCERDTYNSSSDENLLQTAIPNHQCQLLLTGQRGNKKQRLSKHYNVTTEQCQTELLPLLQQDWDWIGTTETLQTTTLPLLTHILLNNGSLGLQIIMTRKNHAKRQNQPVLPDTIQEIGRRSPFDVELYKRVSHERWHRTPA